MDTDHDKGLISSTSSSSTLPIPRPYRVGSKHWYIHKDLISCSSLSTPRPYGVGSKPLSEKLLSKIIDLFGDCYRYNMEQIIQPIDCIDPDDPDTWKDVLEDKDRVHPVNPLYFSPNQNPHRPGEEIEGSPVFELYYIKIKKLDTLRDFSSIYMMGTNTDYHPIIIYNRPQGEEITLNHPLPLKNIFRLPSALDPVTIGLSNPSCRGWKFWHAPYHSSPPYVKYKIRREDIKDQVTDSVAEISCELIQSAAVAELQFTYFNKKGRPIKILSGSIFATTDGKPHTKRLIQQFSSSKQSVVLHSRDPVPVNRSVFGVPLGSSLHVEVNLSWCDVETNKISRVGETLIFPMPDKTKSVEKYINIPYRRERKCISKMMVKVSWWDYI